MAVDIIARGMAAKAQEKADSLGTGISFNGEVSSVYQLPVPSASTQGQLFYLTEAGTTTSDFVDGAGISIPAGTTIGIVEVNGQYKYDTFGQMIDLSTLATKDDVVAVRSVGGTATLLASAWNDGVLTLQIADLNTNDSIIFGAQTEADKAAISAADVLVSVSGQTVTFTANGTVPTDDVNLNFNIIRGSVRSNAFVAGVKSGTFVMVNGSTVSIFNADTKANIDGFYEGLTVGLSENWTPYAEDSGTTQTQPFFLEGTATGNGESRVDAKQVPAFAFLQEKRGNMVCVNQSMYLLNTFVVVNATSVYNNGILTVTTNEGGGRIASNVSVNVVSGHTYLRHIRINAENDIYISFNGQFPAHHGVGSWIDIFYIYQAKTTVTQFLIVEADVETTFQVSDLYYIDLTRWFNGNIPAYLLSHPEAFGRYYKGPLTYEPGRLESATGRYLTSVGRNIWDEEWEVGSISAGTGNNEARSTTIRSKNYVEVSPNVDYYFYINGSGNIGGRLYDAQKNYIGSLTITSNSVFSIPANACYLRFVVLSWYGTTYNHDITISLYYSGESGYDKYYPHEVLATIDTGTESLYSAGSAYDNKVPSGLITRRIGSVDLGTLNWAIYGGVLFYANVPNGKSGVGYNKVNFIISKYENVLIAVNGSAAAAGPNLTSYWDSTNSQILIKDTNYTDAASFKAAMSGVMLYYELATPTTEQGTPFQENVPIDDFGQLSWSNTDVPQGNQIFYPVDYKAYEDTLIKYTDGDATSLVRKTDYASLSQAGVIKGYPAGHGQGVYIDETHVLRLAISNVAEIKSNGPTNNPISPNIQHRSVFYGLSRAAGVNLASSTEETAPDGTNPGVYPAAAIQAILKMLLPAAPTTDGAYDLVCTATNGEPTFSWVART